MPDWNHTPPGGRRRPLLALAALSLVVIPFIVLPWLAWGIGL
jgi:hypothetical protein